MDDYYREDDTEEKVDSISGHGKQSVRAAFDRVVQNLVSKQMPSIIAGKY